MKGPSKRANNSTKQKIFLFSRRIKEKN